MQPDERPDPLAPPEGYGQRQRGQPPVQAGGAPDLSVCSSVADWGGKHCDHPVSAIVWTGCTAGEHAGPLAYCPCHALLVMRGGLTCGQCGGRAQVLKVTGTDGNEQFDLPGGVPGEVWKQVMG